MKGRADSRDLLAKRWENPGPCGERQMAGGMEENSKTAGHSPGGSDERVAR